MKRDSVHIGCNGSHARSPKTEALRKAQKNLVYLEAFEGLQILDLGGARVAKAGVERLRRKLSGTKNFRRDRSKDSPLP